MRRRVSVALLAAMAVAGLAAGILVPSGGAGSKPSRAAPDSRATTRVAVAATDFKFTLSRRSVPTGTVIFTITNKGKLSHDFKIGGKKTPLLSPGHSATLRVMFSTRGRYPYLSTVSGQAAAGMKGVLSVVAPTPTPTTPATTTPTTTTATVGTASTTVIVELWDSGIVLTPPTMASGMVTFVITNKCVVKPNICSFNLEGVKAGAHLNPEQSETWTVALPAGTYHYHCDLAPPGYMIGEFIVTP
jgi:plastocyanin